MLLIELKTRHTGEYWHRGYFQPGPDKAIFPPTKRSLHGGWYYRPGTSPAPARLMPALIWYPPSPCRVAVEHASKNPPPPPELDTACLPASLGLCASSQPVPCCIISLMLVTNPVTRTEHSEPHESTLKPSLQASGLLWGKTMLGTNCVSTAHDFWDYMAQASFLWMGLLKPPCTSLSHSPSFSLTHFQKLCNLTIHSQFLFFPIPQATTMPSYWTSCLCSPSSVGWQGWYWGKW